MAATVTRVSLNRKTPNDVLELIKFHFNDCKLPGYFEDTLISMIDKAPEIDRCEIKPLLEFIFQHPIHSLNRGFVKYHKWFDRTTDEKTGKPLEEQKLVDLSMVDTLIAVEEYGTALDILLNVLHERIATREQVKIEMNFDFLCPLITLKDLDLVEKIIMLFEKCGKEMAAHCWQNKVSKLLDGEPHGEVLDKLMKNKAIRDEYVNFYSSHTYYSNAPFPWKRYRNDKNDQKIISRYPLLIRERMVLVLKLLNIPLNIPGEVGRSMKKLTFDEEFSLLSKLKVLDRMYDELDYCKDGLRFMELKHNFEQAYKKYQDYDFVENKTAIALLMCAFVYMSTFIEVPWLSNENCQLLNTVVHLKEKLKDFSTIDTNVVDEYASILCRKCIEDDEYLVLMKHIFETPLIRACIKQKFTVKGIYYQDEFTTEVFKMIPYYRAEILTIDTAIDLLTSSNDYKSCGYKLAKLIFTTLEGYTGPTQVSKKMFDDCMMRLTLFLY